MSVCPSGGLHRPPEGGGRGREATGAGGWVKNKKKNMHQKQGQKPRRIVLCRACSFSASSIFPLRLRDRRRAAPVPQIQTNSSGSYRRSNKCRTFTFSSEGSTTESPPPLSPVLPSRHQPPLVRIPAATPSPVFRRCLSSSCRRVRISFLPVCSRSRIARVQ
jgi:hypothetical protein